ncbi:MAG: hypothetical protein ACRDQW_02575 [Haloechinothrix sp.]
MQLNAQALQQFGDTVQVPNYDRDEISVGTVWGICGVGSCLWALDSLHRVGARGTLEALRERARS